jgi:hypothetical protein
VLCQLSYAPGCDRWTMVLRSPAPRATGFLLLPQVRRTGRLVPERPLVVGVLDLLRDERSRADDADKQQQLLPHEWASTSRAGVAIVRDQQIMRGARWNRTIDLRVISSAGASVGRFSRPSWSSPSPHDCTKSLSLCCLREHSLARLAVPLDPGLLDSGLL